VVLVTRSWARGLAAAGLPHEIVPFKWQQGFRAMLTFADLWRTEHHRREADRLAGLIRAAHATDGGPVHVIAHSAGTALTCYALERLAPDEAVTSAALVGSGLSPGYDLSPALHRCRAGVLTVDSPLDLFLLGIGTCLLGTADRVWTPAAGMVGFRPPSDATVAGKLTRVTWSPRFVRQGWIGGHTSVAAPGFVRTTLAGWVRQAEAAAHP
jgi:pimeloyl-ACP methyl ester carboxylesterase